MKVEDVPMDETYTTKTGEILPRYRTLKNGAIFDNEARHIVAKHTTSEMGTAMINSRWQKWRDAAASATLKEAQAINPDIKTEHDAWGFLVSKQFLTFLDSEKPRGDDLVKFGQVIGAMPNMTDVRQPDAQDETIVHTLDPEVIALLQQIADAQGQRQDADIIDAAPEYEIPFPQLPKKFTGNRKQPK